MRPSNIIGVAAAWVVATAALVGPADAQDRKRVSMSRQLDGDRPVHIAVQYAVGRLNIRSTETRGQLYRMDLEYDQDLFRPIAEYVPGELRIGTEGVHDGFRFGHDMEASELRLEISNEVPVDLDLEFGAVRAEIDLGGLRITRLHLQTGASETRLRVSKPNPERARVVTFQVGASSFTARELGNLNAAHIIVDAGVGDIRLDFTGKWTADARVSIDLGLGALELTFPRGLGVKLTEDSFLVSFDTQGLVKKGNAYYSLDYEQADVRLVIDIDAAFGSVNVVWVR